MFYLHIFWSDHTEHLWFKTQREAIEAFEKESKLHPVTVYKESATGKLVKIGQS